MLTDTMPAEICFRVTRICNAHCGFCLAPPDGIHPTMHDLSARIDWLLEHGVQTIHFCGGEPTIHPSLPNLIHYVKDRGGKTNLTTNAIALPDGLAQILYSSKTRVKVSLHGHQEHHDRIVGVKAFDRTTRHLRELVAARVITSIQTTIVSGALAELDWVAHFCLENGVKRLSVLPFIPRGSGFARRFEYSLTISERCQLRETVANHRGALAGRVEIRWLDFSSRPIHVVEPDGRIVLEGATEGMDQEIGQIPTENKSDYSIVSPAKILSKTTTSAIIETLQGA